MQKQWVTVYQAIFLVIQNCTFKWTLSFSGIPYQQRSIRLKCVIECFPLCDIVWHRNGKPMPILTERTLNNGVIQASGS